MTTSKRPKHDWSIVDAEKFVQATRDSGYSNTASAVSELVDNALQAGASRIDIDVAQSSPSDGIELSVADNGCGMDLFTLRQALRFGGSSRFNDRSGLGRFGMGLPNSSLSQCRRVNVSSWQGADVGKYQHTNVIGNGRALQTYLDLDEVADGKLIEVPRPRVLHDLPADRPGRSGTIVQWTQCDRLQFKRAATICKHLNRELSRRFRIFLMNGTKITVNGKLLTPFDPLYTRTTMRGRAMPYGDDMTFTISANPANPSAPTGIVSVRFVELPVAKWATLNNKQKRAMSIVNNAGVSIVRADREVDHGWFFFGSKRRENYDDWWRCELRFDPILDDAFGLTHTKQQIRPQQYLLDCLTPDMEATARILSSRARLAHAESKPRAVTSPAAEVAAKHSRYLKPLRGQRGQKGRGRATQYKIVVKHLRNDCFYSVQHDGDDIVLCLDPDHSFYREFYLPLAGDRMENHPNIRSLLELLLLSAGRSELSMSSSDKKAVEKFRVAWSRALQTFVGG